MRLLFLCLWLGLLVGPSCLFTTQLRGEDVANKHPDAFVDFYASIRDQVMSHWQAPNVDYKTVADPVVQIHVENDGSVPPGRIRLLRSCGNSTYDDLALDAAKKIVNLHQPLPEGCRPDIPITFKLTR